MVTFCLKQTKPGKVPETIVTRSWATEASSDLKLVGTVLVRSYSLGHMQRPPSAYLMRV